MALASIVIIVALIFILWSKITHKTLAEVIRELIETIKGVREDSTEYASEIIYD